MRFVKQIKCIGLFRNKGAFWFESEYGRDLKSNHLKFRIFEDHISNGPGQAIVLAMAIDRPFEKPDIFVWFSKVFDKMAAICLNFKWSGFQTSDSIQNPDHLQTNFFWPFRFQIPNVYTLQCELNKLNSGYTILNNSLSNNIKTNFQ